MNKEIKEGYIIVKNPKKYLCIIEDLRLFTNMVKNDFSSYKNHVVYTVRYTGEDLQRIEKFRKLIDKFTELHLDGSCNQY